MDLPCLTALGQYYFRISSLSYIIISGWYALGSCTAWGCVCWSSVSFLFSSSRATFSLSLPASFSSPLGSLIQIWIACRIPLIIPEDYPWICTASISMISHLWHGMLHLSLEGNMVLSRILPQWNRSSMEWWSVVYNPEILLVFTPVEKEEYWKSCFPFVYRNASDSFPSLLTSFSILCWLLFYS